MEAGAVATRDVFSDEELQRLREFPEINRAELIRYFTLAASDEMFVRKFRGSNNVLGAAVQLSTLPWLGFVPDEVTAVPAAAVARLSERLGISAGVLEGAVLAEGHPVRDAWIGQPDPLSTARRTPVGYCELAEEKPYVFRPGACGCEELTDRWVDDTLTSSTTAS